MHSAGALVAIDAGTSGARACADTTEGQELAEVAEPDPRHRGRYDDLHGRYLALTKGS